MQGSYNPFRAMDGTAVDDSSNTTFQLLFAVETVQAFEALAKLKDQDRDRQALRKHWGY